jgi:flagellar hook-associated protein 3 FlgL
MKISTSYMFDRATQSMSNLQNQLATTQAQMSATKQIINPSDAPDKAAAIQRLQGEIDRNTNNSATLKLVMNRFKSEDVALQSSVDVLTRVKELSIQAANDTLSANDRQAIATEMKSLRDELVSLGNTQDDNGNYIFAGTRVTTKPFTQDSNGKIIYNGDQSTTVIPAGVDRTVQYARSGTDVFSRVLHQNSDGSTASVSFFDALDNMISAVDSNNSTEIKSHLQDLNQMVDNMTLSQSQSGSDQNVVQSQLDIMNQTNIRLKSSLSDIQDLDYTTAVTQMNKQMMALQAAMSSFSKVSNLSLFDYVK